MTVQYPPIEEINKRLDELRKKKNELIVEIEAKKKLFKEVEAEELVLMAMMEFLERGEVTSLRKPFP